ncbi:hypothetical protein ACHAW6_005000 [Cyclotella cf. meneghiniana]
MDVVNGVRKIQSSSKSGERFRMHMLEKVRHWVHVDDLEGLLELMVEAMRVNTFFGECLTWLQRKDISVTTRSSESCNGNGGPFQKIMAHMNKFGLKIS